MYVIPIILFVVAILFIIIFHFKKRSVIKKIRCMSPDERCCLLNELAKPFGYCYFLEQDIFSTVNDPWQRDLGYKHVYDVLAPHLNMVFDYQTVYFNYEDRTWLIELWKGQYGINTGCEIGIYHADTIVPPEKYASTRFNAASDEERLPFCIALRKNDKCVGCLQKYHWWLTIFDPGLYSCPNALSMDVSITFPNSQMLFAFREALIAAIPDVSADLYCHTLSFSFKKSSVCYSLWQRFIRNTALLQCRLLCALFRFVTRPFKRSGDKILYLYFYLPFAYKKANQRFASICRRHLWDSIKE